MSAKSKPGPGSINIKVRRELLDRCDDCATMRGFSRSHFVISAIDNFCEQTERLKGQRERTAKAAARKRGQGTAPFGFAPPGNTG